MNNKKLFIFGLIIFLVLLSATSYALNSHTSYTKINSKGAGGSVSVPIINTEIIAQKTDYNLKPGRLVFEFDGKKYAIQVRRVKEDYVNFLVMTLDIDELDDVSAYNLDNSFELEALENMKIDLDKDGIDDISIKLNKIISSGKSNFVRSADFSIERSK